MKMSYFASCDIRQGFDEQRDNRKGEQYMRKLIFIVIITFISASAFADERRFSVPVGDSPSTGPLNAPVTIIEFLDFQ